jgi:hypothetical protein
MAVFFVIAIILYISVTFSKKARKKKVKPTVGRFVNIWLVVVALFLIARISIGWFTTR